MPSSIPWPDANSSYPLPDDSVGVTCTAPVNIAVIKYWGKRDEKLILPINSSLSGTIDQGSMKSNTLIIASKSFTSTTLTLNNSSAPINSRLQAVIAALLTRASPLIHNGQILITPSQWSDYHLHIVSINNFPTAAGLASSAAGYACFTRCLAELYGVVEQFPGELTAIARQGSGSACRSLYGGFVRWSKGSLPDGSDSVASQVIDESHWPELRVLILVANSAQKETSSTDGMQRSVQTSDLLAYRAREVVEPRMKAIEAALVARDFPTFARLTIQDSNQFHATCLDTYPPIFYLNPTSLHIIHLLTAINTPTPVAAYTFDAGPNAVVYCLEERVEELLNVFEWYYGGGEGWVYDPMGLVEGRKGGAREDWVKAGGEKKEGVKVHQVIVSKIGRGAEITGKTHTFH